MNFRKIKKLFNQPKQFFRDAKKNKREEFSVLGQKNLYCYHFSDWKKSFLKTWFPHNNLIFLPFCLTQKNFNENYSELILENFGDGFLLWGMNAPDFLLQFLKKNNIPYFFVEDGFLRSKELGAKHTPPASLVFDSETLYYNCREASTLEIILQTYDFKNDHELLMRSDKLRELLLITGVSKYNPDSAVSVDELYGIKVKKRILVLGQVQDDASIKYGCYKKYNSNYLLELAIAENPGAQIIYKPHPDVLNGLRKGAVGKYKEVLVLNEEVPLSESFKTIDHVYTITSLSGFEALLRGIKVTTLGCPFYSGWGLTDDRQINKRRTRKLGLSELLAGAYILYPRYHHPYTKEDTTPEKIISFLASC
ncbi:capsular polysaccharide export protein, LipB/KpsS family [Ignatzschineria sp. LJL83]